MENLALDRCLEGVERAQTAAHICYSYPMPRASHPFGDSYPVILEALEHSNIDQLALEIEASKLGPELLGPCPSKAVMFECIDNSIEEVETPGHVADQLLGAAKYKSAEQIQAAPNCGVVLPSLDIARAKLWAMV